ncbi:MAG: hypothetical protein V1719_00210 [Patescibacteria group bacterium]
MKQKQKQKRHFHKFTSRLIEFSNRQVNRAMFVMLLIVTTVLVINVPNIVQYFTAHPSSAFDAINPSFPPSIGGTPVPWGKAPWGNGPSDDLPNPDFEISINPLRRLVFAGLDTRFEIKIDTNMGFGVANDGIIELFSPELDEAMNNNKITDYRFKSEYPWPNNPIFCGPDSHFTVFLYVDTFINTDLGNTYSNIPFTVVGISNQTASYEETGGTGEYIITRNTDQARTIIKNTDWKPFGNTSTVGEGSQSGQMYENKVVFSKFNWTTLHDIYIKDMSTEVTTPICTATGEQYFPVIYENYIAWTDYRNENPDIYMYDLSDPLAGEKNITAGSDLSDRFSAIYGKYIVYVHGSLFEPEYSLNIYNIENQTTTVLEYAHKPGSLDIYKDKIIWTEGSDYPHALIHLYDMSTGEEDILTAQTDGDQTYAQIHKNLVVWAERILSGSPTNLTTKVHLYNLDNHTDTVIADYNDIGGFIAVYINVSDDWAIWLGDETNEMPAEQDVFFHKISDPIGENYKITDNNNQESVLSVFGNKAIYNDHLTSTVKVFELLN